MCLALSSLETEAFPFMLCLMTQTQRRDRRERKTEQLNKQQLRSKAKRWDYIICEKYGIAVVSFTSFSDGNSNHFIYLFMPTTSSLSLPLSFCTFILHLNLHGWQHQRQINSHLSLLTNKQLQIPILSFFFSSTFQSNYSI